MAETRIRTFGAVLILVLMTFGDAGAREMPSRQETVGSHTQTGGGQNTSPGGETPCGAPPAEGDSRETEKRKEICLPSARKEGQQKKKEKAKETGKRISEKKC